MLLPIVSIIATVSMLPHSFDSALDRLEFSPRRLFGRILNVSSGSAATGLDLRHREGQAPSPAETSTRNYSNKSTEKRVAVRCTGFSLASWLFDHS